MYGVTYMKMKRASWRKGWNNKYFKVWKLYWDLGDSNGGVGWARGGLGGELEIAVGGGEGVGEQLIECKDKFVVGRVWEMLEKV